MSSFWRPATAVVETFPESLNGTCPGLETLLYLFTRARNPLERGATSALPSASRTVVEGKSWVGGTLSPRFSLAQVKRSEATRRIDGLLGPVAGGEGAYLPRVREVWIFGSYARGALEVGDIDLAVEFDQTKDEAGRWFATLMAGGFDHLGALRRELRGNQRVLELHFNELDDLRKEGFEPRLLWRRGESLEESAHSTCWLGAGCERAPCRARHGSSALGHGREADPAACASRVLAVHVGRLARRQARRATAAAGGKPGDPPSPCRAVVRVQSALPCGVRRRELPRARGSCAADRGRNALLRRAGGPRCGAGLLAAERGSPLWCQVLKWAMLDFGQGIPRVLLVLNPTARKHALSRARHAGDYRPRGVLPVPAWRRPAEADRALGQRLPGGRAPRLHARVRRLARNAHDASHVLSHRPFRPNCASPSPKPVPKIRGPRQRNPECLLFPRLSVLQATPHLRAPPNQGGAPLNRRRR